MFWYVSQPFCRSFSLWSFWCCACCNPASAEPHPGVFARQKGQVYRDARTGVALQKNLLLLLERTLQTLLLRRQQALLRALAIQLAPTLLQRSHVAAHLCTASRG